MAGDLITVLGATGKVGRVLTQRLLAERRNLAVVGRDPKVLQSLGCDRFHIADFGDSGAMQAALSGAQVVVSCAHARFVPAVLDAIPDKKSRFVLMGSTRRFTRFPDRAADEVRAGEAAFVRSGRVGVMLHPTMIYGAQAENNLQRIARLVRLCPVVPLPGGGRSLVQPIHIEDVVECLVAAVDRPGAVGTPLVIAGPTPVTYAELVRAVAACAGRRAIVVNVPVVALFALAGMTRLLPGVPSVTAAEIRRLAEDKACDIGDMQRRLGVRPISLADGLARTFG